MRSIFGLWLCRKNSGCNNHLRSWCGMKRAASDAKGKMKKGLSKINGGSLLERADEERFVWDYLQKGLLICNSFLTTK